MTHTPTKPAADKLMWRRLKARVHPDAGGSHEDFIWVASIEELVCSGLLKETPAPVPSSPRPESTPNSDPDRVPFSSAVPFAALTGHTLQIAASRSDVYGDLLTLLADCLPLDHMRREQERGASYKQLAAIGHKVGMDVKERSRWYRVAESIPLSGRHAGHIISKLKRRV